MRASTICPARIAGWTVSLIFLAVLGSCAGIVPPRPVDPLTLVPRQLSAADGIREYPTYANRLVINGHSFGLPEGWTFLSPPGGADSAGTFSLSGDQGNVLGLVEFIDLETDLTGLTPELFIHNVREIAEHRSDSLAWDLFTITHNPADAVSPQILRYYVLAEEDRLTVVVTGTGPEAPIAPLGGRYDIVVIQFLCRSCLAAAEDREALQALAGAFITNHQLPGRDHDGRFVPEGPVFHRLIHQWRWFSDRPGGFVLRDDQEATTATLVSLFQGDYREEAEFSRFKTMDPTVSGGESWLLVGPAAVLLEFEMIFIPRTAAVSGPRYGTIHTLGTFMHRNTRYSLVIEQNVVVPSQPDWERSMLATPELAQLLQLCIVLGSP